MDIVKRAASLEDSELILGWRNSSSAIEVSQFGNKVHDSEHRNWFETRVTQIPCEPFWIMSVLDKDIGYVRLDLKNQDLDIYTISIFVVPEFRSIGYGSRMLRMALNSAISETSARFFRAVINKSNQRSIALFQEFGFILEGEIDKNFDEYLAVIHRINTDANNL
jgi:RimJ/RimL family protein N-acetyltransferase